jgi:hypothetical protein
MADNPLAPFAEAAKRGELDAFRAAADFLRERGQPAAGPDELSDEERAFVIEVAQLELVVRHAQAAQARRLLAIAPEVPNPGDATARLGVNAIARLLARYGLYWNVFRCDSARLRNNHVADETHTRAAGSENTSNAYFVECPTDRVDEDRTAQQFVAFLNRFYPRARFIIHFTNRCLSEAGEMGRSELGLPVM